MADRSKVTTAQITQGPTGSGSTLNLGDDFLEDTFEEPLTIEQRKSSNTELEPNEYPGKEHRNDISHRND